MRRAIACLRFSIIIVLMSSSMFAGAVGVRQLTLYYAPEKWELFPIEVNPFVPFYSTELSVPGTVALSVDVFAIDHESKSRSLVRRIVQPGERCFRPAVYAIDWWCVCDSSDMPVSGGIYSIVVRAFEQSPWDKAIFTDSIEVIVFEGKWDDLEYGPADFEAGILRNWDIRNDGSLEKTDVSSEVSEMEVVAARMLGAIDSSGTGKLVVKLKDVLGPPYRDAFRSDARGYICVEDSASPAGYRILREITPFGGMHSVWQLSLVEGELLMIDCTSHWPVIVDATQFLDKLRASGELK